MVNRYAIDYRGDFYTAETGQWVDYTDYALLESRCAVLEAQLERWQRESMAKTPSGAGDGGGINGWPGEYGMGRSG